MEKFFVTFINFNVLGDCLEVKHKIDEYSSSSREKFN